MTSRIDRRARLAIASGLLGAFVLLPGASGAQNAPTDARWQAWVGCWRPVDAPLESDRSNSAPTICVIPAAGTSAVDVVTVVNGEIAARERLEATGEQRSASRDGCTGWQRAEWSPDGRRLYVRAEYECEGGVKRTMSGLFAMSAEGDWLDVEGITQGENTGVRVARYEEVRYGDALPNEIAAALRGNARSDWARTVATSPLASQDVVEASRHLDAAVVEAWLVERGEGFDLDAKRLVALAEAGLPERVIDVMVALSYPRVFAINRNTRQGEFRSADSARGAYSYGGRHVGPIYADRYGYSSCAWGYRSWYGYSPYGCGGYGYGYGYGWYPGDRGVIIIERPDGGEAKPRGRAVKGRGYTRGDRDSGGSSGSGASSSRRSRESSGSSDSGSRGGTTKSSDGGSSSGRTAKPRSP